MIRWGDGWVASATLCLVLALGCAGGPIQRFDGSEVKREYAEALRLAGTEPAAGRAALERFLRSHPQSDLADDAGLRLAELQVAAGARVAATRTLERVIKRQPSGDRTDSARLLLARLLADRGLPRQAYRQASKIRLDQLDAPARRDTLRLLVELARDNRDTVAQLRWLARLQADAESEARLAATDSEIRSVLNALDAAELDAVAEQLGRRVPAARVRLRQAELAFAAGELEAANDALERARQLPLGRSDAAYLTAVERRLAGGEAQRLLGYSPLAPTPGTPVLGRASGTLGVVLPLTGRYASYGEATFQGILLATGHFDASRQGRPSDIRLLVRDTGGDPARAAAAIRELAGRSEVSAILGPMLAAESEAAAAVAQELGIPLLTFSRRESVDEGRDRVLRLGETPRLEAELMAAYAVETLGLKRFAILYPDLEFGRGLRAAFWDAVEARGGEVVGVARYEPEATDFSKPVRRLIGYELLTNGQVEAIRERDRLLKRAKRLPPEAAAELRKSARETTGPMDSALPPFIDFEALFIPDSHETVGLIAPHLAFHSVRGVRLLGTSPWNDPELLRLGGRHVDGAVFTAGSFGASQRPHMAEYERRFSERFDRAPGDLAAAAFDAANLAVVGLARAGTDRAGLLRSLRSLGRWAGVSGTIGFDRDGTPWKRPHLLGVERGAFVSVDERGEPPFLHIPGPPLVCEPGPDGEEVCVPETIEGDDAGMGDGSEPATQKTSR